MAQLQEAAASSRRISEPADHGEPIGTYRPVPYLELPAKPWTSDHNQESPEQPSSAFQTAQGTPIDPMQTRDGFPFHAEHPNLDGTVVPPIYHHDPEPFTYQSTESDLVTSAQHSPSTPLKENGDIHPASAEAKNVSFANGFGLGLSPITGLKANGRPTDAVRSRRSDRYISKMKAPFALRLVGNAQNTQDGDSTSPSSKHTPPASPRRILHRRGQSEGDQPDADVDELEDVDSNAIRGPAMKRRRLHAEPSHTAPATTQTFAVPNIDADSDADTPGPSSEHRRFRPIRSVTMDDAYDRDHQGLSEDEGRARFDKSKAWRQRSSAWVQGVRRGSAQEGPSRHRPRHIRSVTTEDGSGAGPSNAAASPSAWRVRAEPAARQWRQLKAGFSFMIPKKRDDKHAQDQAKSTELVTELVAGAPAAAIITSHFIRDEHRQKRIPVLLEQLKVTIVDSTLQEDTGANRNILFRIELEYGSGDMRMKWVIHRTLRDFWNLHVKFGAQITLVANVRRSTRGGKKSKMPRFPRTAFPFAGDHNDPAIDMEEDEEQPAEETPEGVQPPTPVTRPKHRRGPSSIQYRRRSSVAPSESLGAVGSDPATTTGDGQAGKKTTNPTTLADKQRAKLESYLKAMLRFVMFRPGMNRMCAFLELSALGIKLAVEGGYHGKEGFLRLQSGKGIDFRREWLPKSIYQRHRSQWFLVRSSYIVCVDSPASMNIYDVFLIDSEFKQAPKRERVRDQKNAKAMAKTAGHAARHPQTHILRIENSERKLRLFARNERQLEHFENSIRDAAALTPWSKRHRFGSFAPPRTNVFAQPLVDGRDYMWQVSRALDQARDVIYIHDWWLSPEIYMRRPGAISHKWRLDRILKRKAEEGVKIFVIVYRNIESAIPIDSEYTKHALLDLHTNIFVQRSPNQYRSSVFFWAHHEKICIVDQTVAFCGGVDLCFGRWDTPDHRLVDDRPTGWETDAKELNADNCQSWAGKDYSNARVRDFFQLNQPFAEMYDRTKVPRMPWHDIGMQIVGQPARDLTRHFVQRWNFLLRVRRTSRPTPFLMPPPDFNPKQLEELGLDGTCTVQILRSASEWSLGTPGITEHSIMTAYCKLIQTSEHFIYIENQFFVSTCTVEGTKIRNTIGDALVERIIRAHKNDEKWAAVIVIPLMPGFEATPDAQDGTSLRLIMECQYRSICRGETSIFGRLRAAGIKPTDYIRFFSLRAWGKIGSDKSIVTEQLYIHAKVMVVDDRHAIIGSANINERSMLGDRDSEVAACIFDNDMIDSDMAGKPYKVGRFPHDLRVRLMREHLGVDVDHVMDHDHSFDANNDEDRPSTRPRTSSTGKMSAHLSEADDAFDTTSEVPGTHTFNHDAPDLDTMKYTTANKAPTFDSRVTGTDAHRKDVAGYGIDNMHAYEDKPASKGRDTVLLEDGREVLVNDVGPSNNDALLAPSRTPGTNSRQSMASDQEVDGKESTEAPLPPRPAMDRLQTVDLGLPTRSQLPALPITDDTNIGGPPLQKTFTRKSIESLNPVLAKLHRPVVTKDCMRDPLNPSFLHEIWQAVAEDNTKLYRQVFRCMPDSDVTNWAQYHSAMAYAERFAQSQGMAESHTKMQQETHGRTGPPGHDFGVPTHKFSKVKQQAMSPDSANKPKGLARKLSEAILRKPGPNRPSTADTNMQSINEEKSSSADATDDIDEKDLQTPSPANTSGSHVDFDTRPLKEKQDRDALNEKSVPLTDGTSPTEASDTSKRRKRAATKSSGKSMDSVPDRAEAEAVVNLIQGHLVEWPYDWLEQEERGGKWLFSLDQMSPLEIYN